MIIIVFSSNLHAQSIHFSQNLISRVSYNPSLVGYFLENDYRISFHRRSQWASVSKPFTTLLTSFEAKKIYKKVNFGVEFYNDKSGDANLTKNQINIAISSNLNLFRDNQIMVGSSLGFGQKAINNDKLSFEQSENLINNSFLFSDISIGVSYIGKLFERYSFIVSNSYQHLNKPKNSFNNQGYKLNIKNNTYASLTRVVNNNLTVTAESLYSKQGKNKELVVGLKPEFKLYNLKLYQISHYRLRDALIIGLGVKKNNIQTIITYDINISDLEVASNNRGGFEFSILYFFNRKQKLQLEQKPCPKYL